MKKYILWLWILGTACTSSTQTTEDNSTTQDTLSTTIDTISSTPAKSETDKSLGYRAELEGDFDGDGQKEKLQEHYVSRTTGQELSKNYPEIEFDSLVGLVISRHPKVYLSSANSAIKDLPISDHDQLFGIMQLINEGDLNGDGTDELSYIIDYADYSNVNRFYIYTYKNSEWKEIANFEIREWQLEDQKPLFTKNTDGTITAKTFDEEANEVEKKIQLK